MRAISQTLITSRKQLLSELSDLLQVENATLWAVDFLVDEPPGRSQPNHEQGGSQTHPAKPEEEDAEDGPCSDFCAVEKVRVLVVCKDQGCKQKKDGWCSPTVLKAPEVKCLCLRIPPVIPEEDDSDEVI